MNLEKLLRLKVAGDPREMAGQLVLEIARSGLSKKRPKVYPSFAPTKGFAAVLMTLAALQWDEMVCPEKEIGDCITIITQAAGEGWQEWEEALRLFIADNTDTSPKYEN